MDNLDQNMGHLDHLDYLERYALQELAASIVSKAQICLDAGQIDSSGASRFMATRYAIYEIIQELVDSLDNQNDS